jgi:PhnB protein
MKLNPYLFFNGRCDEAIDFYRTAIGAELEMAMRYKDGPQNPDHPLPEGWGEKIMHASLRIPGGDALLCSDGDRAGGPSFVGFSLSLETTTAEEAERAFAALSEGGKVTQPLIETFFSARFGMLEDRFGLGWMITVAQAA